MLVGRQFPLWLKLSRSGVITWLKALENWMGLKHQNLRELSISLLISVLTMDQRLRVLGKLKILSPFVDICWRMLRLHWYRETHSRITLVFASPMPPHPSPPYKLPWRELRKHLLGSGLQSLFNKNEH